jgi:hypothetical protein
MIQNLPARLYDSFNWCEFKPGIGSFLICGGARASARFTPRNALADEAA